MALESETSGVDPALLQDGTEALITETPESPGKEKDKDKKEPKQEGEEGSDGKGGTVHITVHPPEFREGKFGVGSYHTYKVTMVPNEVEHVFRRYRDFEWLRTALVNWYPCLFVPPLPPKKTFGNTDEKFVADRRLDLQRFLIRVAGIPHLANSQPFKLFMARSQTFDEGVKELDTKVKERVVLVVLKDYKETFPAAFDSEKKIENPDGKTAALKEFLENSEKKLNTLALEAENLANAMVNVTALLGKVSVALDQMYTEEKGFPQRPEPARFDIMESVNQWHLGVKQITPHYNSTFAKNFQNELLDIQAFLELFKQRDYILGEQKKAAKKADKWRTMEGLLTQPQEQAKGEDFEKEAGWTEILNACTQMILGPEFERVWKDRTVGFHSAMTSFAGEQLSVSKLSVGIWETLSGSS